MKKILLLLMFMGCSKDAPVPTIFEQELFTLEIKEWGAWPTHNSSNANPDWNGRAGIVVAHSLWGEDVDLKIEYELIIRGARSQDDIARLIPIHESKFVMFGQGLICRQTHTKLVPLYTIDSSIIPAG